ncbi:MAG TPA: pectinesterase family protein, partial [Rectinemataceae bacterium]|nr:pectinesterase family protein [Rectinemataceae bacterium]
TIVSLDREESVNGYISAPSTLPGQAFGFVFLDCLLESEAEPGSVFLGRPWRSTAKVAFIRCEMGRHIADVGWDNWDNPENEKTAEFAEYGNHGPGVKRRVPWALMLDARQAQRFSPRSVLSGPDSWEPFVH